MSESLFPIVLIAPAMGIGSRYYRPLEAALADHGWQVHTLPRRGFEQGDPSASRTHDWSYADEIAVLTAAVTSARTEQPQRPVIVLGHSLGGHLTIGHELGHGNLDGIVLVGSAFPHHPYYPLRGLPILVMGSVIIPVLTRVCGYLPPPAFGAPGARTMMREWARTVRTGRVPFPTPRTIDAPTLVVSLGGDQYAPRQAVDALAADHIDPAALTRWHYGDDELVEGASNDHVAWVRQPQQVVDRLIAWWHQRDRPGRAIPGPLNEPAETPARP